MLEIKQVNTYYGKSHILFDLSLRVERNEIVTLLGRNGAGKTTTLRTILGLTPPRSGTITFDERPLAKMKPFRIARLGIALVPEDRCIFSDLTVLENLNIARRSGGSWTLQRVLDVFPVLQERIRHRGCHLSGGEQQMLAIARALMGNPDLLLLDEPSGGLAPIIVQRVSDLISQMSEAGMTILLVEQNVPMALSLGQKHYILDQGKIVYEGSTESLRDQSEIQEAYLGASTPIRSREEGGGQREHY